LTISPIILFLFDPSAEAILLTPTTPLKTYPEIDDLLLRFSSKPVFPFIT